jgi:hypothetical protein
MDMKKRVENIVCILSSHSCTSSTGGWDAWVRAIPRLFLFKISRQKQNGMRFWGLKQTTEL